MKTVAQKLKSQLVTEPERSVTDLAKHLDIGRPALSNVLNGNADLSMELALKIESKFGISAKKLLIAQLMQKLSELRATLEKR